MNAQLTLLDELQAAVITTPPSKLLELVRRAAQEIAVLQERAGAAKRGVTRERPAGERVHPLERAADLDRKIAEAKAAGRTYTPTDEEYRRALQYQREQMTWPRSILDQIRRERA